MLRTRSRFPISEKRERRKRYQTRSTAAPAFEKTHTWKSRLLRRVSTKGRGTEKVSELQEEFGRRTRPLGVGGRQIEESTVRSELAGQGADHCGPTPEGVLATGSPEYPPPESRKRTAQHGAGKGENTGTRCFGVRPVALAPRGRRARLG